MKSKLPTEMRTKGIVLKLSLLVIGTTVMAVVTQPFSSWENLIRTSPDIIIARCSETPDPYNVRKDGMLVDMKDGVIDSGIVVISVLKGATNWGAVRLEPAQLGPARLSSQYWPRQGEQYLIFAIYYDANYQAVESYRIIPLGVGFPTNILAGKSLDEQIRMLLQYRLDQLNLDLGKGQEEKKRLEGGLKK